MPRRLTLREGVAFIEADVTVDTTALSQIVKDAFLLSMDGRVSEGQQGALNAYGVALRAQLRELLGKIFDADADKLRRANTTITAVNAALKKAKADIDKVADTVEQLGKLVSQLDGLLKIAAAPL